jgi:hypothetical protein
MLHGVMSQKIEFFIATTVRNSNPALYELLLVFATSLISCYTPSQSEYITGDSEVGLSLWEAELV